MRRASLLLSLCACGGPDHQDCDQVDLDGCAFAPALPTG